MLTARAGNGGALLEFSSPANAAVKVKLRPRVPHHGGATKTAVEE